MLTFLVRRVALVALVVLALPIAVNAQGGNPGRPGWSVRPPSSSMRLLCLPTGAKPSPTSPTSPVSGAWPTSGTWPTCATLESLFLCDHSRSLAVERTAKEKCGHTCNTCKKVDMRETARSAGIDTDAHERGLGDTPARKWGPFYSCEAFASDTNSTRAQEHAAECFALRRCRAEVLPKAEDYNLSIDDDETSTHMLAHCRQKNGTNESLTCCAGSPYPGLGGGPPQLLMRPPPPPPPPPPPRNLWPTKTWTPLDRAMELGVGRRDRAALDRELRYHHRELR